jgi:hypothetical protein
MEVMLFMMVQKVVKSFQKLPIFQKISKYYPEVNSYLIFFFVNKSRKYVKTTFFSKNYHEVNSCPILINFFINKSRIKCQPYIFFSYLSIFHLLGEFKNHLSLFIFRLQSLFLKFVKQL